MTKETPPIHHHVLELATLARQQNPSLSKKQAIQLGGSLSHFLSNLPYYSPSGDSIIDMGLSRIHEVDAHRFNLSRLSMQAKAIANQMFVYEDSVELGYRWCCLVEPKQNSRIVFTMNYTSIN